MADDLGIDLTTISGSGAHGKVTKEDVRHAAEAQTEAPLSPAPPSPVTVEAPPARPGRATRGRRSPGNAG
jgi:pyruvate dehydrogenase E2 component (dihydrolipoamide acetyltransferase)